ncbi:MAG: S9 family peptidase [Deltaproteobacteria bacterium]|jgi:dipeptidyl aminopeptidase/acylaminoacyl peptidase|nr:S9 family peptidase [Deltaproteobacteria bacterium]MBW2535565.1 S9 family peptidase [Deltaproteobacteria bacterium]
MKPQRSALLLALLGSLAATASCGPPAPLPVAAPTAPPTAAAPALPAPPQVDPTLVQRKVLFGNPDRASVQVSPDGRRIGFLAPRDGVLNVYVAPLADPGQAKPVTNDRKRGIRRYFFAYDNRHLIYLQDKGGDENWRVYAVDLESGGEKDLTPFDKVQARISNVSHEIPDAILVALNNRDPRLHDIHRVDLATGKLTLVQKNDQGFLYIMTDDQYRVRFGIKMLQNGGQQLVQPDGNQGWKPFLDIGPEDTLTTGPAGFDKQATSLYLLDSRGRNLSAMTRIEIATGKQTVLAADDRADVEDAIIHPTEKTVQAVSASYLRKRWHVLDPAFKADLEVLKKQSTGDLELASRSLDDRHWIAAFVVDDGPVRYYHYDRTTKQARFLFTNRKALEGLPLAKMHPVEIPARDGLKLVSYLTVPPKADPEADGRPAKPVPMVLFVHGGPWGRDSWGYHSYHQWLASRGYAVLSVNFRGSTGFGKTFINAADKQWAAKMHDDLIDAVRWAVNQGVADVSKVAIMGGSYGGYATLVGLSFTPDVFACGVDIVGPSSLITLLENVPPYWIPMMPLLKTRVGDHETPAGRRLLLERSPLTRVDHIVRPLLIGQGANDPRVKQQESDQIVRAMQAKGIAVTYVLFPDEGHGFARPENRLSFNAVAEIFLAQCLGGPYQPIGEDFQGASVQVPAGADQIHTLSGVLAATQPPKQDAAHRGGP